MQVLLHGKPIQEETTKDILLEIMADKYSRAILESTVDVSKSALELSIDCGIPISTAYRRVQQLHTHKLLGISGSINDDGKKYFLYKSKIKSIVTCFNNGALDIEIVPNSTISNQELSKFLSCPPTLRIIQAPQIHGRVQMMMTRRMPYTTPVITLRPENSIHDALFLMRKNDIKRVVIVNNDVPIGMVTERDIGRFLQNDKTSRMLNKIYLNEIMSRNLFTISKDQDDLLIQCAIRMDAFQIGSIIIIDNEKLVGIVTKSDLTKHFSDSFAGAYRVKDYMNTKMITCRKSDSLLFALAILNRNKIARLVVTDNDGRPVGIISYGTFLRNSEYFKPGKQNTRDYLLPKTTAKELLVSDLIGNELLTIKSEDDLAKAARFMVEYKISGIPVVDENGNLEGVISATDIIRAYHEVKVHAMLQKNDPHFT